MGKGGIIKPMLFSDQNFFNETPLGSVIFVSPLKSMDCTELTADFEKPRSNDFKRLGEK
jgi:hypothetical protein